MKGKLIVIEGLDGSGKSTQLNILKNRLCDEGLHVRQIKLPNYEDKSSELVKMYLGGRFGSDPDCVNAYAASSFYAVDRYVSPTHITSSQKSKKKITILSCPGLRIMNM